jgi:carbonic anhydrase
MTEWGYCENNGPQVWPEKFSIASTGKRQSPIDINTTNCLMRNDFGDGNPLKISYPQTFSGLTIQNTGHGWKVDIPDQLAEKTSLNGGPLQHNYRLAQFHCHWGKDCSVGSEHTVNGKSYAAELHFVHWNTSLFKSPAEAMPNDNGLAVLGVFLEIGSETNEELEKVLSQIDKIIFKGDKTDIAQDLNIEKLLPENRSFWTYLGSLTTPPLSESVTWIVFSNPIKCTEDQIAKFRDLCYCNRNDRLSEGKLLENFRLPQPIHERIVTFVSI